MKLIIALKIILAVAALSSIVLGIYLFLHAGTELAAPLTFWALGMNALLIVLLLGIFLLEKRLKIKEKH
jgi:hypothetical protein